MEKGRIFIEMKSISGYFERNIKETILFEPEFLASQKINNIIENTNILYTELVIEILQIFNDVSRIEHYDGTGWMDYRMHICHLLKVNGFETDLVGKEIILK